MGIYDFSETMRMVESIHTRGHGLRIRKIDRGYVVSDSTTTCIGFLAPVSHDDVRNRLLKMRSIDYSIMTVEPYPDGSYVCEVIYQ